MLDLHYPSIANIQPGERTMNSEQKVAWFTIAVCLSALIAFGILHTLYGMPVAFAAFSLLGLTGFNPILFRQSKSLKRVEFDERDLSIQRRANVTAGMCSYLIFVLSCMGVWFVQFSAGKGEIGISVLPMIVTAGGIMLFLTRSAAIIVLYRSGGGYAEG